MHVTGENRGRQTERVQIGEKTCDSFAPKARRTIARASPRAGRWRSSESTRRRFRHRPARHDQARKAAVERAAIDRAADDEMVTAPRLPVPQFALVRNVRPKSESVNVVTLSAALIAFIARWKALFLRRPKPTNGGCEFALERKSGRSFRCDRHE